MRRGLLAGLTAILAVLLSGHPVLAEDSTIGTGTITRLSVVLLSQTVDEGGNTIQHRTVTRAISGFLNGTVVDDDTRVITPVGDVSQTGLGTCTCAVAGQTGTLVWSYEATVVPIGGGLFRFAGNFEIVGGTDGLAGLQGEAGFVAEGTPGVAVATYSGEFGFE